MAASPTARTLAKLKALGWKPAVCERWNSHARVRQDLWGFADVLAFRPDKRGVLAIQATSRSNLSARRKKLLALPDVLDFLRAGNRVECWGWAKKKPRGGGQSRWLVERWALTEADFATS